MLMDIPRLIAGLPPLTQEQSSNLMPVSREMVLVELLASSLNPSKCQCQTFREREKAANSQLQHNISSSADLSKQVHKKSYPDSCISDPNFTRNQEKSPEFMASEFASETVILSILGEAVAIGRAIQKRKRICAPKGPGPRSSRIMAHGQGRAGTKTTIHPL